WAYLSTHPSKRLHSFCYDDDDEDYTSAITPNEPVLSTEEPDNSLSMGDEHLDTIPATKSDEVIKSSVENLIPVPSESEGIPEHMRDVPFHDNSSPFDVLKGQIKDFSESNDEVSSTDDDSFSIDEIDYVEASPPDYELVSSEVMEIVIPKVGGIDDDIILTIKDDILREKLLNVNLLIAKIEALNANPTPSSDCKTKPDVSHRCGTVMKFNTHRSQLNECPMLINGKNTPILDVKENQEKDKIGSKPDKKRKRGEAGKSQKQLQSRKKEKLKKIQVEGPKMQTHSKLLKKEERKGLICNFLKVSSTGARTVSV
nr:hypothetical protein [Tanacetum cinerariifolium]